MSDIEKIKTIHKELDEFIQFCFDHGAFLRNHKQFGEMSSHLMELVTNLAAGTVQYLQPSIYEGPYEVVTQNISCPRCGCVHPIRIPVRRTN